MVMIYIISMLLLMAIAVLKIPAVTILMNTIPYASSIYMASIFLAVFFALPIGKKPTRLAVRKQVFFQGIAGALIYIAITFFLGAMLAQIKLTPYDISSEGIVHNIVLVVPAILARERIREYILSNTWRKKIASKIWMVLIVFALSDIYFPNLQQLKSKSEILIYLAQYTVPSITSGVLLTVLGYYGGFRASAAYALTYAMFIRLFPFLPDLTWLAESAIGIIFPIIFAMIVRENAMAGEGGRRHKLEKITPGYVISLIFTILITWFAVGVFPIYPSVILTGSMEPMIMPGDMILIKKGMSQEEIEGYQVGDVINFNRDSINITHRIIEVMVDNAGNYTFRTKGDNNDSEDDDIVELTEVNGKQIFTIPKIGIPAMMIRSYQPTPEGVVDETTQKME